MGCSVLTTGDHHPDEVHEEIIEPKVIGLGSGVGNVLIVEVEHAGGVI